MINAIVDSSYYGVYLFIWKTDNNKVAKYATVVVVVVVVVVIKKL
jgi:hypothetical protein